MNKCFLLNLEKEFGKHPSYRFREKRKNRLAPTHFNSVKVMSLSQFCRSWGYSRIPWEFFWGEGANLSKIWAKFRQIWVKVINVTFKHAGLTTRCQTETFYKSIFMLSR